MNETVQQERETSCKAIRDLISSCAAHRMIAKRHLNWELNEGCRGCRRLTEKTCAGRVHLDRCGMSHAWETGV